MKRKQINLWEMWMGIGMRNYIGRRGLWNEKFGTENGMKWAYFTIHR